MAVKILLIGLLLVLMFWILANRNAAKMRAWKKIGVMLFMIFAIFNVLFPDTSNQIAHHLGVGRGADLLTYVNAVAFIFLSFNIYLKSFDENHRIAELGRKIALLEAELSKKTNK